MGTCLAKVDYKLRKRGGREQGYEPRRLDSTSDQEGGRLGGLEAHLQYSELIASGVRWLTKKESFLEGSAKLFWHVMVFVREGKIS